MRSLLASLAAAAALGGCAYGDYGYGYDGYGHSNGGYGEYRYAGDAWSDRGGRPWVSGPGAALLDPWLAETQEGRDVVSLGFDGDADGRITEETADRANIWFRRYADHDRDLALTDEEIRIALVQASRSHGALR